MKTSIFLKYLFLFIIFSWKPHVIAQQVNYAGVKELTDKIIPPGNSVELDELRAERNRMRDRTRRIIFNNDGGDVTHMLKRHQPTAENLLDQRATPLAGTSVDAIFYCAFYDPDRTRHPTKVGEQMLVEELQGMDPLQVMVDWCKEHDIEIFASMRMNQSMGRGHRPDNPMLSRFQLEHPESLVGWYDNRPPHEQWSNFDYAHPADRDLVVDVFQEVCQNYDLDGLELDFFRLPVFLKTVAWGGQATDEELEMLTDMMRRLRVMTEVDGLRRGRPFLIAIRVPGSFGYCRDMGLDLERWLEEGLVDMLITSDMWRLNEWGYSVSMARKHGVKVYAGLSDSRLPDPSCPVQRRTYFTHRMRSSNEALRARAAEAWHAGMDGIYLFNHHFCPREPQLSDSLTFIEISSPETLAGLDKTYFVNYRDGRHRIIFALSNGMEYLNRRILTPGHDGKPLHLRPDFFEEIDIRIAEERPAEGGLHPEFSLHLLTEAAHPLAWLNGEALEPAGRQGSWINYHVPSSAVNPGINRIRLLPTWGESVLEYRADAGYPAPRAYAPLMKDFEFPQFFRENDLGGWPDGLPELPWQYQPTGPPGGRRPEWLDPDNGVTPRDGALLIASEKESGMLVYWDWHASPTDSNYVKARVKVLSGTNAIIFSDGEHEDGLLIFPDRIELRNSGKTHAMNTTDGFYTYRVEIRSPHIEVYLNGELIIDGDISRHKAPGGENRVSFGVPGDSSPGRALCQEVEAKSSLGNTGLFDVMITVRYQ